MNLYDYETHKLALKMRKTQEEFKGTTDKTIETLNDVCNRVDRIENMLSDILYMVKDTKRMTEVMLSGVKEE